MLDSDCHIRHIDCQPYLELGKLTGRTIYRNWSINMALNQTFGIGGYCMNCDPSHDHPPHNIIEEVEIPDDAV